MSHIFYTIIFLVYVSCKQLNLYVVYLVVNNLTTIRKWGGELSPPHNLPTYLLADYDVVHINPRLRIALTKRAVNVEVKRRVFILVAERTLHIKA